jgi:homoserine O-acetyltransferase
MTGWSDVPGWWPSMVGPGLPFDTDTYFVVCPNVIGGCQGSTGPSSIAPDGKRWGSRFPALTIRDMVNAEIAFTDAIGIEKYKLAVGPSLGGMRALEWAVQLPDRVGAICTIGSQLLQLVIKSEPHQFKFVPLNPIHISTRAIITSKRSARMKEWNCPPHCASDL